MIESGVHLKGDGSSRVASDRVEVQKKKTKRTKTTGKPEVIGRSGRTSASGKGKEGRAGGRPGEKKKKVPQLEPLSFITEEGSMG